MAGERERVEALVRQGATAQVTFPDGIQTDPLPILGVRITEDTLAWYSVGNEERGNGVDISHIAHGDDGEVLVRDPDDRIITISGLWDQTDIDQLASYVEVVRQGAVGPLYEGPGWVIYGALVPYIRRTEDMT
jgi:hypothetical protein